MKSKYTLVHGAQKAQMPKPSFLRARLAESVAGLKGAAGKIAASLYWANMRETGDSWQPAPAGKAVRVGIWDLGAFVGGIRNVIAALNRSQRAIEFYDIQAAVPSGLAATVDYLRITAIAQLGRPLTDVEIADLRPAMLADDFFRRSEAVRLDLKLDYLVSVTPMPLARIYEPPGQARTIHCDLFSTSSDRNSVVSADGLFKFAERAQQPYEMAVAYLVVGAVLYALNERADFHEENRACLFDFNNDRESILGGLRKPKICQACLELIDDGYRNPAIAMMRALDHYQQPENFV
jgi:hypothetical protein